MSNGFTPPYTPSGRSSLVRPPPWHYAGQILSLAFTVERRAAQDLLPEELEATGAAAGHFCEWQSTTDGSELLDPVYAQYKEFIALIECRRGRDRVFYCPFIYVDQDISIARGWLQGLPKKIGNIWMTRSYGLGHIAAAPLRDGSRFGASLAVKDRRLAETSVILTGEPVQPIGMLALPMVGLTGSPTLVGSPDAGAKTLLRATIPAQVQGPAYGAAGELKFFDSPRDELSLLSPVGVTAASLCTFALTVTGAAEA